MWSATVPAVDHSELGDHVGQVMLLRCPGTQVHTPSVQPGFLLFLSQEPEDRLIVSCAGCRHRSRIDLKEAVQDDPIAILVSVEPVQHVGRLELEPPQFRTRAVPRDDADPGGQIAEETRGVLAHRESIRVPEHRAVVEHRVVLGDRHIVAEPRSRQRYVAVVDEIIGLIHDTVTHVRSIYPVVKEHHLARVLVDFRVS